MTPENRELLAHGAVALNRYIRDARRDALPLPPALAFVAGFLTDCAQVRPGATKLDESLTSGNAAAMTDSLLIGKREVAAKLDISVRQVERLIADGRLPAVKLTPGNTKVRRADLDAYVKALPSVLEDQDAAS